MGVTFTQFRGFVINLDFDKKPDEYYLQSKCSARVLIGWYTSFQNYEIVDRGIIILHRINLSNVFIPPPWYPQPRLLFNYWMDRNIILPIYVNGFIIE